MPRYVLFDKLWIRLQNHGYPSICPLCDKPIEVGQEVFSLKKSHERTRRRYKHDNLIFHALCYDKQQEEKRQVNALKENVTTPMRKEFSTNFTVNKYYCHNCKKDVKAIVFRERFGTSRFGRMLGLICPTCGYPIMQYEPLPKDYSKSKESYS